MLDTQPYILSKSPYSGTELLLPSLIFGPEHSQTQQKEFRARPKKKCSIIAHREPCAASDVLLCLLATSFPSLLVLLAVSGPVSENGNLGCIRFENASLKGILGGFLMR